MLQVLLAVLVLVVSTAHGGQAPPSSALNMLRGEMSKSELQFSHMHSYFQQQHRHRRLTANDTLDDAVDEANEIGRSVRDAIKKMRGGSDDFYQDLIHAVQIILCDKKVKDKSLDPEKNPSIRFVSNTSDLAYKDDNGVCIRINRNLLIEPSVIAEYDTSYMCEVKPNCYWREINATNDNRYAVYAEDVGLSSNDMTYDDAKDKLMKWLQGLLVFVVPGIILAALSLLTMIFFLLCRCCCNRCGGRSPKEGGYTCMQKFLPLLFFLLFSIGVVAVAGASLIYQKTLTSAVSDIFDAASHTLGNGTQWVVKLQTPLESVSNNVMVSADKISLTLTDTTFIEKGITGITNALDGFQHDTADQTLPTNCTISADNAYCVACDVCTTISKSVGDASKEIKDKAGPGVVKLNEVRSMLTTELVTIKDSVRSQIDDAVNSMLKDLNTSISDGSDQVTEYRGHYDDQKIAQQAGVLVLFALALVVIVLGLIGILFGLTPLKFLANIIHIAYVIGFIALIITFIVSSVFLAVSVLLGDACEITLIFVKDWTVPLGHTTAGDVANACFGNDSLIDVLDLSKSLNFSNIDFPNLDTSTMLNFSSLNTFTTEIKSTDASTFNINTTLPLDFFTNLIKYTKQTDIICDPNDGNYSQSNIFTPWIANSESATGDAADVYMRKRYENYDATCTLGNGETFQCANATNPCKFSEFISELYAPAYKFIELENSADAFVTVMHTNIDNVKTVTDDFTANTTALNKKIVTIKDDLTSNLLKYVDQFKAEMYCTFIKDGFFEVYHALCGDLMPAFTMISLLLFLAGVFLIPVNICLIIALKRLKARGNGSHVMDNEMKFK
uniref:Uncharacterized protein n=1 Tax=Globisporangium ultimum (strain ATCC 200006 / CBS 805.95 / DAOM BR144) TaxID=431595 RepID=K3WNE0_GLOUD